MTKHTGAGKNRRPTAESVSPNPLQMLLEGSWGHKSKARIEQGLPFLGLLLLRAALPFLQKPSPGTASPPAHIPCQ